MSYSVLDWFAKEGSDSTSITQSLFAVFYSRLALILGRQYRMHALKR